MINGTDEAFRTFLYILGVVFLPIIAAEIVVLLYKLIQISKESKEITSNLNSLSVKLDKMSDDPETLKLFTQEIVSYTINDVINQQTSNFSKRIIDKIIGFSTGLKGNQ